MKKLVTLFLCAVFCMSTVNAYAVPAGRDDSVKTYNMTGAYSYTLTASYAVDVAWDTLVFSCSDTFDWNTASQTFERTTVWSDISNTVTVTNRSNAPVTVVLNVTNEPDFSTITAGLSKKSMSLAACSPGAIPASDISELTVSGSPTAMQATLAATCVKIATVNISVS